MIIAALALLAALCGPPAAPLPACVYEDGSGGPTPCVWVASERGNGTGTTVTINR